MDIQRARERIDRIDDAIIGLLSERMSLMPGLADYKRKNSIPIENKRREKEVLKRLRKKAGKLSKGFAERIFSMVMEEAKRVQRSHLRKRKA